MKRILATTALVMIMASGAYAANERIGSYQTQVTDIKASEFIGQRIYAVDTMPATDMVAAGAEKDWDDIGEINEVILGRDGQVKAVVLGIGGFLGMGEKNVAVPMTDVKFVKEGDNATDYFLVVNANKESLTNLPAYVSAEEKVDAAANTAANTTVDPNTTANTTADTNTATDTAANSVATDSNTTSSTTTDTGTMLVRPDIQREGYVAADAAELTAEKLTGAEVYGPKDENVGEINRIVLTPDGKVDKVVLDIGGFLGMGAREVAVSMDQLNIVRNSNGDDVRIYIDSNQGALKALPEYKG